MKTHRTRTIVAAVLGVLTVVLLTVTLTAVWARAIVVRSEPVTRMVTDALDEPAVQADLATWITDQIAGSVDLEVRLTDRLPDNLDRLAPVLANGARTVVEGTITRALGNDTVQQALVTVVERAHSRVLDLLRGDGLRDGINVADGAVSLNLLPLVARGLEAVQSLGLLDDVEIPEITAAGDPDEQIAALSAALGRDLPDDFGQLVVYQSDSISSAQESVQSAQRTVVLARRALWLLVIVSVALIAATILVAPDRWQAVFGLGVGAAAMMVVMRAALRRTIDDAPDLVEGDGARTAVETILGDAGQSLLRLFGVVLLVAVLATVAALLVRRQWRDDLVLLAAVVAGTATVAIIGFSLVGIVLGIALAVGVAVAARRLVPASPAPPRPGTGVAVVS